MEDKTKEIPMILYYIGSFTHDSTSGNNKKLKHLKNN